MFQGLVGNRRGSMRFAQRTIKGIVGAPPVGTPPSDHIIDADADTIVHTETTSDEDIVRVTTAGTLRGAWDALGLALVVDYRLIFDRDESGDTYWVYNSSNDYMELYVDGDLRAQF